MKKLSFFSVVLFLSILLVHCSKEDENHTNPPNETLTDADGNVYNTLQIGTQVWMSENLKTTKYKDGTPINEWSFGNDWYNGNDSIAWFQWTGTADLNNVYDEELPFDFYGAQYNHFAMESGMLAPDGWRIPTLQDFITLENFIANDGHEGNEATVLKSTTGWISSSGNGTDLYGFTGLPNGYVSAFGSSTATEIICTWATSTLDTINHTRSVVNLYDADTILYFDNGISLGAGIRCIKE